MAQDTAQIRVGANGSIRVAPVGTAAPADESAAYGAGWTELGLVTEDGVKQRDSKTIQAFRSWQLFYDARRQITAREFLASFQLQQWNKDTVKLAFGGGAVTTLSAGHYKYEPPEPQDIDLRAMGIDWQDGSYVYRILIPKGIVTESVETDFKKDSEGLLPITFSVLGTAGVKPWYFLTNDPAFS